MYHHTPDNNHVRNTRYWRKQMVYVLHCCPTRKSHIHIRTFNPFLNRVCTCCLTFSKQKSHSPIEVSSYSHLSVCITKISTNTEGIHNGTWILPSCSSRVVLAALRLCIYIQFRNFLAYHEWTWFFDPCYVSLLFRRRKPFISSCPCLECCRIPYRTTTVHCLTVVDDDDLWTSICKWGISILLARQIVDGSPVVQATNCLSGQAKISRWHLFVYMKFRLHCNELSPNRSRMINWYHYQSLCAISQPTHPSYNVQIGHC